MSETTTPTARVLKKAGEVKTTTDATGRIIKFKTLRASELLDLVSVLGAERAMNGFAYSMAMSTFQVVDIDGIPMFPPENYKQLKKNMDELQEEGIAAIFKASNPSPEDEDKDSAVEKEEPKKTK